MMMELNEMSFAFWWIWFLTFREDYLVVIVVEVIVVKWPQAWEEEPAMDAHLLRKQQTSVYFQVLSVYYEYIADSFTIQSFA